MYDDVGKGRSVVSVLLSVYGFIAHFCRAVDKRVGHRRSAITVGNDGSYEGAGPVTKQPRGIQENRLVLQDADLIASGYSRFCYRHPYDSSLCIKIDREPDNLISATEAEYLMRLSRARRRSEFEALATYKGAIDTTKGQGFVYQLIRQSESQEIAPTLAQFLAGRDWRDDEDRLNKGLARFRRAVIRDGIYTRDLTVHNVCVLTDRDGSYRFVQVDGAGRKWSVLDGWRTLMSLRIWNRLRRRSELRDIRDLVAKSNVTIANWQNTNSTPARTEMRDA